MGSIGHVIYRTQQGDKINIIWGGVYCVHISLFIGQALQADMLKRNWMMALHTTYSVHCMRRLYLVC